MRHSAKGGTGYQSRIDDADLYQILVFVSSDVEADSRLLALDPVYNDGAFQAGVVGQLAERFLKRTGDDVDASSLVTGGFYLLHRADHIDQGDAAARHDTLFQSSASSVQGILDTVLLLSSPSRWPRQP